MVEDPIKSTLEGLLNVLKSDNVIGETIETETSVLVPVTRLGLGFGAGTGQGENRTEGKDSKGSAAGGGAAVEPVAIIVVSKTDPGDVRVLSLKNPDPIVRAIGEVGSVAERLISKYQDKPEPSED